VCNGSSRQQPEQKVIISAMFKTETVKKCPPLALMHAETLTNGCGNDGVTQHAKSVF